MATIATLTQKADGNFEGTLAALNVTAQIAVVPNTRKAKDNEPDFRIISRKNGLSLARAGTASRRTPARNTSRSRSRPLSSGRSTAMSRPLRAKTRPRRSSSGTPPADQSRPGPASNRGAGPQLLYVISILPCLGYIERF